MTGSVRAQGPLAPGQKAEAGRLAAPSAQIARDLASPGMTVGIMPVTGLPLPYVSYGGSAMFVGMIAVGLPQSVRRRCVFLELTVFAT